MKLVSIVFCSLLAAYFAGHALVAILMYEEFLGTNVHLVRYLLAPAAIALVFLAVAFLANTKIRLLTSLYAASLLLALYLVEAVLTHQFYFRGSANPVKASAIPGIDLGFTPKRLNHYIETTEPRTAVLGHVPFTTIELCSVDYGPAHIATDRFGLNNPDAIFDQPVHTVVTGDSFVHGHCQPPGRDFVALARSELPGIANMGLTGTGQLVQLQVIGRHVAVLAPANVLVCFYEGNDLKDVEGEFAEPWLAAGLAADVDFGPSPALPERLARVAELNRRHQAGETLDPYLMGHLRLDLGWSDLLRNPPMLRNFLALNLTSSMLGLSYGRAPNHLAELRAVLERTQEVVDGWGGQLHLCYLPSRQRLGVITSHYAYDQIRAPVLDIAHQLGLPVFDVTPAFAAHARPRSLYASDGHFSIEGAELVAQHLVDYLTDHVSGQ